MEPNAQFVIQKFDRETGVTRYLLGHSPGCHTWGADQHKAERFADEHMAEVVADVVRDRNNETEVISVVPAR